MTQAANFDAREFRSTLGTFTTGVTIITTVDGSGQVAGLTANSFSSVSLDPPLVLWSIGKSSRCFDTFTRADFWAVHILARDQEALSDHFASKLDDKFVGLEYQQGISGLPLLPGCLATLQCKTEMSHEGGDHIILIGRVLEFQRSDKSPLVFSQGRYAGLEH